MLARNVLRLVGGAMPLCATFLVAPAQVSASAQSQVEFHVNRVEYSSLDLESVRAFVYKEFLQSGASKKYGHVVLEMPALERGSSYLLVNLLHLEDYGMSHARIDLEQGKVSKVTRDYVPKDDEYYDGTQPGSCPDPEMRVVWGMARVGRKNPAAVKAMTQAENAVKKTKLKYKYLSQRETTTQQYKNWLACPRVTYFGSISHGSPRGFQLEDGTLSTRYFKSQANAEAFKCRTMWMTACQAHNNPLLGAIKGTGTSYYVSGIRNISFGSGDRTHGCFWEKIFADEGSITVEKATKDCADAHYGGWPAVYGMTKQGVEPWECDPEEENPEGEETGGETEGESTGDETEGESGDGESGEDESKDGTAEPEASDLEDEKEDESPSGSSESPDSKEDEGSAESENKTEDKSEDKSEEDTAESKSSDDEDATESASNGANEDAPREGSGCSVGSLSDTRRVLWTALLLPLGLLRRRSSC